MKGYVEMVKEQIKEMAKALMNAINEKQGHTSMRALAEALYNAGYRKQEWISVDDRLPDTDEVLVYCRKGVGHAAPKKQGLDKMDWDVFFNITGTTHWMPLPQPPKMKGGAE